MFKAKPFESCWQAVKDEIEHKSLLYLSPANCRCPHLPSNNCLWRYCPAIAGRGSSSCSYRKRRSWTGNGLASNDHCSTRDMSSWGQQCRYIFLNHVLHCFWSFTLKACHQINTRKKMDQVLFRSHRQEPFNKSWMKCCFFLFVIPSGDLPHVYATIPKSRTKTQYWWKQVKAFVQKDQKNTRLEGKKKTQSGTLECDLYARPREIQGRN